jgi:cytoskeletal protein RodZ
MDTFGDRLKSEREDRGLSIEAVAEILRIDHEPLMALERNDFDALPEESVMMACLHAYAECLDVDADLMIEDYSQERDRYLQRLEDVGVEPIDETAPPAIATEPERRLRVSPWPVALVVVAIAILAAWWMLSRDGTAPTPETSMTTALVEPQPLQSTTPPDVTSTPVKPQPLSSTTPADVAPTPVEPQPLPSTTPADVAPTPVEPPAARSADATTAPSLPRIAEYGVGTAVENRQLVGQSDRFTEGTRVWFWTRVEGGSPGDRIDHVWFREGVEATHISLEIGGSSWRTYSIQTLFAGAAGDWAVEARDDAGRVLARSEFVCVP